MYGVVLGDIIGSWYEWHNTIAAIAGGIAEAYYREKPKDILDQGRFILDSGLKKVLDEFHEKYCK